MATEPGSRLGPYQVLAQLGRGGMGEVYRAHDDRLGREVAVKVLPDRFSAEPGRVALFQREARSLAALNHPGIAAIYGIEESDGTRFLVLELVEGETLAERLLRSALPVSESLTVCARIAEALAAAHENRMLHRDLKPSNVKISPDGKVKLLDFGLAKAFGARPEPTSDDSATTTAPLTREGVVHGTAPYMSPEQARGEELDRRTDVWSFGCVLYETLTGARAFPGRTASESIAGVLAHEPKWDALPGSTPDTVRSLLRRCLRKDRSRRLGDIADVGLVLEDVLSEPTPASRARTDDTARPARRWIAGVAAVVSLVGLGLWALPPGAPPPPHVPLRLSITIPGATEVGDHVAYHSLDLSPDGSRLVAYAEVHGVRGLFDRPLGRLAAIGIPNSAGASNPFFSPDGQWLGFWDGSTRMLMKVPADGGVPIELCEAPSLRGASWGADGTILFAPTFGGLWRVSEEGGTPEEVTRHAEGEENHRWPDILPGGRAALFTVMASSSRQDESQIAVVSLETGEWSVLLEGGTYARYVETGHIVYGRNGSLLAVPFDVERLAVTGTAVPVVDDVWMDSFATGVAQFSISPSGALAYVAKSASVPQRSLVWVDRQGRAEPLPGLLGGIGGPRLSPDGRSLAISIQEGANADIWLLDLARDTTTRLTFGRNNYFAVWMRDSAHVVFSSNRGGEFNLFKTPVDGSGSATPLRAPGQHQVPTSVSPDGRFLAYHQQAADTFQDIWVLPLDAGGTPRLSVGTLFFEVGGVFSPDGRWLAYVSQESGRDEVYVRPFPGPGRRWLISTEGGAEPMWSPVGGELFYRQGGRMISVPVQTQPTFQPGSPRVLFEGAYFAKLAGRPEYDVTPDGQRFVMVREPGASDPDNRQIVYVPDFFGELESAFAARPLEDD